MVPVKLSSGALSLCSACSVEIQSQTFDEFGVPPRIADLGEDLPLNDVERIDGL